MPAVSVVIATRDYGRFVGQAIASVLDQTFPDFELVVIDDGSADDTPAVLQQFDDPRMRCHRTDGLGQSRGKNLGIRLSRSPLIAFLDGDDAWLPTKLERQLPLFRDPAVGVVYSRRFLMNEIGQPLPTPSKELHRGDLVDVLVRENPICFSSSVVRRSTIDAVGLFDESLSLSIDYDWWLRLSHHCRFDFVNEPLVRYRTGHANLSSRVEDRVRAILSILKRQPRRCPEGIASTCRTMGYVVRQRSPLGAVSWYLRAARHDGGWWRSVKSVVGGFVRHA